MKIDVSLAITGTIILTPSGGDSGPTFLDNLNGAAGGISGNADTGQERQQSNGLILLTGTGAAHLDDNNSPDIALLQWAGVTVPDGSTFKVTLATNGGDSPIVFFNANLSGSGNGWGLVINDDDNLVKIAQYDNILVTNILGGDNSMTVAAGIAANEAVEVTVILSGDSITLSAKGSSQTFTYEPRSLKNQSGFGVLFDQYNTTRQLHKVELVS